MKNYNLARGIKSILERGVLSATEFDAHAEVAKTTSEPHAHRADLVERSLYDVQEVALANMEAKMKGVISPRGTTFYAPFNETLELSRRDISVASTNGATVGWRPPQLDLSLQPGSVVPFCTILTGLRGNAPIVDAKPMPTGWEGETGTIGDSSQIFSNTLMKPFPVAGQVKVSRQLLLTAAPGFDEYLRREISRSLISQIGTMVLAGTGTNEPVGVANASGVNAVTLSSPPTWAQIVSCEVNAATQNITDFSSFAYALNTTELGVQKETAKGANLFGQLTDVDGRTNGFPTVTTTALNSGPKLIAGPWDCVLVGLWGSGIELLVDEWTQAGSGLVILTATCFADLLVRYAASFTVGN